MYHVVEFMDTCEVEVVPANWLSGNKCFWPPSKSIVASHKAARNRDQPTSLWSLYNIRVLYSHESYEHAMTKLPDATEMSDLQTEEEDANIPEYLRRKNRGCKRIDTDEEAPACSPAARKKSYTQLVNAPQITAPEAIFGENLASSSAVTTHWSLEAPTCSPPARKKPRTQLVNAPHIKAPEALLRENFPSSSITTPWSPVVPTPPWNPPRRPSDSTADLIPPQEQHLDHSMTPEHGRVSVEAVPTSLLREILIQLTTIREQQMLILVQLQSHSTGRPVSEALPEASHCRLPLSSQEDLQNLEVLLKNPEEKRNLTVHLGIVGGLTVKETVWRIMKRTVTTSLAKGLNWSGANGKPAFKNLALKLVVLDAVRRNVLTKDASDKQIEQLITRWLQLAADRDGGRSQRAQRGRQAS
ncbi:uncharacterized protein LOC132882599 [Neoarius graeffei]|uniref:uncharacterized protein LOC132882599 n=1 Tax=Neoarius graeffei TaxID=443677 RepID=UPI00298C7FF3|nr:uncharacterized protein LOC132882599 [Neoarius graeffei]